MDVEKGCLLPLFQSAITGILAGLLAGAVGMWQGWSSPWSLALVVGAAGAVLVWVGGLTAWRRSIYPPIVYPAPIVDEDPAPIPPKSVRVELRRDEGQSHHTQIADLPVSHDQLVTLAVGLLSGAPFSETSWTGAGKPFSRGEFAAVRSEFLRRNWAQWRNDRAPAQGVVLSAPGKAVLRSFASEVHYPTGMQVVSKE